MEPKKDKLIFLVDDDKMFLKTMELYIRQFFNNYTIRTFYTGEECLNSIHQKPDIVLLDYMLNGNYPDAMDGIKVLIQIKKTNPEITVIMFSAQDHIDIAVDTMKHGAFDYIVKNDKMFLRVQNAIKNVIYNLVLKQDMKEYKRKMRLLGILIAVIIGALVYVSIFCRSFLQV